MMGMGRLPPARVGVMTSSPPESPRGVECMDFGRGQGVGPNAVVQLRGGSVTQRSAERRVLGDRVGFGAGCLGLSSGTIGARRAPLPTEHR